MTRFVRSTFVGGPLDGDVRWVALDGDYAPHEARLPGCPVYVWTRTAPAAEVYALPLPRE